jgi:Protein of unknown function (DUF4012)
LSGAQLDVSPAETTRNYDISSWKNGKISHLTAGEKKRYYKRKSAIRAYFTTEDSLEDLSLRYRLSAHTITQLAGQCLMQHEDGSPWGFRALLPGVIVLDHTPLPDVPVTPSAETPVSEEDTARAALFGDVEAAPADLALSADDDDTAEREAVRLGNHALARVSEDTQPAQPLEEHTLPIADNLETASIVEHEALPAASLAPAGEDAIITVMDGVPPGQEDAINRAPTETAAPVEVAEPVVGEAMNSSPGEVADVAVEDVPVRAPETAMRSLAVREEMLPTVIARINKRPPITLSRHMLLARRSVRRGWVRQQKRAGRVRTHRLIAGAVVASMLLALLVPLVAGFAAYNAYTSIRNVALDGVSHLMSVKAMLPVSKSDPTAVLNAPKLEQARAQLAQAQSDFIQLQQLVDQPGIQATIQQYAPQYAGKVGMAQRLVQVGIDVTQMGSELIGVALLGANLLHSSPLASGSTKPLITDADVSNVEAAMSHTLYYINDIRALMSQVPLSELPISAAQQNELTSLLSLLPKVQSYVIQGQGLIGLVSWLLGAGQPRRFLVQTMDSAELRPGGGFTGQYGILQIQGGRVAPFSLQDVTELDYAGNGAELGRQAPPQYRSWMNFGNWGLRDANLSGDFPTTAQLAIQVYQDEGGGPVDGDIAFTPVLIEHILDIIGPIQVPQYNETITAQNLEDKLHYYQQNQAAIALQQQKTGTHNAATRKAFTTLLGKLLLDRVMHLPVPMLLKIAQGAVKDIQSRDLEIYFTNPQAEAWLVDHGYSGATSTFSNQDGFMVVQANISISKASQYVQTTYQDAISLDAQGGATHTLTITLDYQQKGPVYGQNTYADYIRVYAPANAAFQWGDGFDTGKPLCNGPQVPGGKGGSGNGGGTGGPPVQPPPPPSGGSRGTNPSLPPCTQFANSFPSNARYCPDNNYNLSGPNSFVPGKGFITWPVDNLGPPTQMTSDLPGRAMWGGLTVTPMNCISTITLSWYVPDVVKHIPGQPIYSVLVQKQGGYIPTAQISIDTSQLNGVKPYNFQGDLVADRTFSLQIVNPKHP